MSLNIAVGGAPKLNPQLDPKLGPALELGESENGLATDLMTRRKIELNLSRNRKQDHTAKLDAAAAAFDYEQCRDQMWNPEQHSLLWGTPLWDEASAAQRVLLNQLYWVGYYAQIISAEIATIFFNQTSAAGLYGMENFRSVCDMLDLESAQERAHINAFKTVGEQVEAAVFGERVFTYPMRGPYVETMILGQTSKILSFWKSLQLRAFSLLSSGNAFIAASYFLVRGIRTLNGKIVQHELSRFAQDQSDPSLAPIPTQISYFHFMDESYHFNSSTIISHDVIRCLKPPTAFERMVVNMAVRGCQRDHSHFSALVSGIFWHDASVFPTVYKILRSRAFGMSEAEALRMLERCFCEDNAGIQRAAATHKLAQDSYREYVADLPFVSGANKEMAIMAGASAERYLGENRAALRRFGLELARSPRS